MQLLEDPLADLLAVGGIVLFLSGIGSHSTRDYIGYPSILEIVFGIGPTASTVIAFGGLAALVVSAWLKRLPSSSDERDWVPTEDEMDEWPKGEE